MTREVPVTACLVALGIGCKSLPPRVPPELFLVGGVAATNSPMFADRPQPCWLNGRLDFVYSAVFENLGRDRVDLELAGAQVLLGDMKGNARCSARGYEVPAVSLMPSDRWRIDCQVQFPGVTAEGLRQADGTVLLSIPIRRSTEQLRLQFTYWLRSDDAS
jgi:hypothetical protein